MLLARRGSIASARRSTGLTGPTRGTPVAVNITSDPQTLNIDATGARLLVAGVLLEHSSTPAAPTALSYEGSAMTLGVNHLHSGGLARLLGYYLFDPPAGSAPLQVTADLAAAGPTGIVMACAYSNGGGRVITNAAPEATDSDDGSGGQIVNNITTVSADALVVGFVASGNQSSDFEVDTSPTPGQQTLVDVFNQTDGATTNALGFGDIRKAGTAGVKNFAWQITLGGNPAVQMGAAMAFATTAA